MARILIIDDDKDYRETLRLILVDAGHEIMEAAYGTEAVELLAQNNVELVIVDIIMREQEGTDLIKDLNKVSPELKVIAITGGGIEAYQQQKMKTAAMHGTIYTLHKPFEKTLLLRQVEDCLTGATNGRWMGAG